MSSLSSLTELRDQLRWKGYLGARAAYWFWKSRTSDVILGRCACLGQDVLRVLAPPQPVINLQKGRIDYIVDCGECPSLRARTAHVVPHLERQAITGCIAQEELIGRWLDLKAPRLLFMDSMAELGDQLFVHRRASWRFTTAYTDIAHNDAFERSFESSGLLALDVLRDQFRRFLGYIRQRFGGIPIIYLHFPAAIERRERFRARHDAIREAIESVAPAFGAVFSIAVDGAIVRRREDCPPDMIDYAYHYNQETYTRFAELVRDTTAWRALMSQEPARVA